VGEGEGDHEPNLVKYKRNSYTSFVTYLHARKSLPPKSGKQFLLDSCKTVMPPYHDGRHSDLGRHSQHFNCPFRLMRILQKKVM